MRKLYIFVYFFISFFFLNCSNTVGPSCTNWITLTCFDYANTSSTYQKAAEQLCLSSFGIWAKTGCAYSKCGSADTNGQITCTGP